MIIHSALLCLLKLLLLVISFGVSVRSQEETLDTHRSNSEQNSYKNHTFYFSIPSYQCSAHFKAGLLETLNEDRAARGYAPLTESPDLTFEAQAWALANGRLGYYRPADPRFGQYLFNAAQDPELANQSTDLRSSATPRRWSSAECSTRSTRLSLESGRTRPAMRLVLPTKPRYHQSHFAEHDYEVSSKVGFGCSTFKGTGNSSAGSLTVVFFEWDIGNYHIETVAKRCWECPMFLNATTPPPKGAPEKPTTAASSAEVVPNFHEHEEDTTCNDNDQAAFTLPIPSLNASEALFGAVLCRLNQLRTEQSLPPLAYDPHLNFRALEWASTGGYLGEYRWWDFFFGQAADPNNNGRDFRPKVSTFDFNHLLPAFRMRTYSEQEWAVTRKVGLGVSTLFNLRNPGKVTVFVVMLFYHPSVTPGPVPTPPPVVPTTTIATTTTTEAPTTPTTTTETPTTPTPTPTPTTTETPTTPTTTTEAPTTTTETPLTTTAPNPDDIIPLPLPLADHCPRNVELILLEQFNRAREQQGLLPLCNNSPQLTAHAQEFSALHLNSSVWADARFESHGEVRWAESTTTEPAVDTSSVVGVNVKGVGELLVYQFPPNEMTTNASYPARPVGRGGRGDDDNNGGRKVTTVIVAFFDTEGQCPDPNFVDPNDGNRYPVPLSGHCPAHVQSVLGGYVNERRLEDGLEGLQLTADLSADAQTFTDCHHRGLDCWAVPRFANYGLAFYEHTFANSDVATTHLDLDKDLLGPWMARPDRVLRVDRSIPFTPEEWARVRVMGFGCGSWIGPRESDLIDQRATLFVVAFFSSSGGGGEDPSPDPEPYPDDDPEYVIPQECASSRACRPSTLDPSGLTSALAQDFTNHHMSWASFYNASFAGHGFDGDRLMYLPAPPDNRPLRVHLKYTLQLVAAEAVVLRPSRLGVLGEHFDPEEWAQTKVMGLGCTSWPSEWLQGKENGGGGDGGGAGIAQRVVVQARALDAVSGQAIGNESVGGSKCDHHYHHHNYADYDYDYDHSHNDHYYDDAEDDNYYYYTDYYYYHHHHDNYHHAYYYHHLHDHSVDDDHHLYHSSTRQF
ncbi:hypothetical protein TYRP_001582 [Tyrophagus putrescentiae]|nr:hypothetical protein TYRP_001582 [Tyrophagus putrescentiae]